MTQKDSFTTIAVVSVFYIVVGCANTDNTAPAPGNLNAFNPIGAFPKIAAFAGEQAGIVEIVAKYVLPNGTMDLEAEYKPNVEYRFVVFRSAKDYRDEGPLPPGAKRDDYRYVNIKVFEPSTYHVTIGAGRHSSERLTKNKGMERHVSSTTDNNEEVIPPPKCDFSELWKNIPNSQAYKNDSAVIKYSKEGYKLELNGAKKTFWFKLDCSNRIMGRWDWQG